MHRDPGMASPVFLRVAGAICIVGLIGYASYRAAAAGAAGAQGRVQPYAVDSAGIRGADRSSSAGPVRMAHFVYVRGKVDWRPDSQASWTRAVSNLMVLKGSQISCGPGSRAVLAFDDGSRLYIGRGALVDLNTLYSDADGEYTELGLRDGTIGLRVRTNRSVFQVDCPSITADTTGPSQCRFDALNGVQAAVFQGSCVVEGGPGKRTLGAGQYIDVRGASAPFDVLGIPQRDDFDDWFLNLTGRQDRQLSGASYRYLPRNVALAADDLDAYGTWRHDRRYGRVWHPRVHRAHWRPYHYGRWTWCAPYGWVWVDDEPWGWAPSHYGTWVYEPYGWAWCPGPVYQYWSPAVVGFADYGSRVVWYPLAPAEVRYPPTFSIGFAGGDWSLFFSIGGAATYYPTYAGYFAPSPWPVSYVNYFAYAPSYVIDNRCTYITNPAFVPFNALYAPGCSVASVSVFVGGGGTYGFLAGDPRAVFGRSRFVAAPASGFVSVAGPAVAQPNRLAFAPTRSVLARDPVSRALLTRPLRSAGGPAASRIVAARTAIPSAFHGAATAALARRAMPRGPAASAPVRGPAAARPGVAAARPSAAAGGRRTPSAAAMSPAQQAAAARTRLGIRPGAGRPGAAAPQARTARAPGRAGAAAIAGRTAAMRARTTLGMAHRSPNAAPTVARQQGVGAKAGMIAKRGGAGAMRQAHASRQSLRGNAHGVTARPSVRAATRQGGGARGAGGPAVQRRAGQHAYAHAAPRHASRQAATGRRYVAPTRTHARAARSYRQSSHGSYGQARRYRSSTRSHGSSGRHFAAQTRRYRAPSRSYSPARAHSAPRQASRGGGGHSAPRGGGGGGPHGGGGHDRKRG